MFDLGHRVVAESLFPHPLERVLVGVIPTEADLDVVLARHDPFRDQALDPGTVADQVSQCHGSVIVGIEMDDADVAVAVDVGHTGDVGIRQRVIAADDEWYHVPAIGVLHPGHFGYDLADLVDRPLGAERVRRRIAVVRQLQLRPGVHQGVHLRHGPFAPGAVDVAVGAQVVGASRGAADPEAHVGVGRDESYVDFTGRQILRQEGDRGAEEGRDALVRHAPVIALDVDGPWFPALAQVFAAELPDVVGGIGGIHGYDGFDTFLDRCRPLRVAVDLG